MPHESEVRSKRAQFALVKMRSIPEIEHEIRKPCGRFRSPYARTHALKARILGLGERIASSEHARFGGGTPLNWQLLLDYLYDEKIIARPAFDIPDMPNDVPRMPTFRLHPHTQKKRPDGRDVIYGGFSNETSAEESMSKAIGEILERHLLAVHERVAFTRASFRTLQLRGARPLNLAHLNGYLPFQTQRQPRFRRDHDTELNWIDGIEWENGARAAIPAQLVFWAYNHALDKKEPVLANSTTSGSGGHFTREEAVLSGVRELLERDAFFMWWLNTLSPPRIDFSEVRNEALVSLLASVSRYGLQPVFLDATSDIAVPVIVCVLFDRREGRPAAAVGAGAGFSIERCMLHALSEALSVLAHTSHCEAFLLPAEYAPFTSHTIQRKQRLSLWVGDAMLDRMAFFTAGPTKPLRDLLDRFRPFDSPASEIAHIRNLLKEKGPGYELYVHEISHRVLEEVGYHVVRTVVPRLFPLYLDESMATLDSERLRDFPNFVGDASKAEMNPWPHPFP